MVDAFVVNDKAIPLLNQAEIDYANKYSNRMLIDKLSLSECMCIKEELTKLLNKISVILSTFPAQTYKNYNQDELLGYSIGNLNKEIVVFLATYRKNVELNRLQDMTYGAKGVFSAYNSISRRIFKLQREENYKHYIREDAKRVLDYIKDVYEVQNLSDIVLKKERFKTLFNRTVLSDSVLALSRGRFIKLMRKIDNYSDIYSIPEVVLICGFYYILQYFIKDSVCDTNFLGLYENGYRFLGSKLK